MQTYLSTLVVGLINSRFLMIMFDVSSLSLSEPHLEVVLSIKSQNFERSDVNPGIKLFKMHSATSQIIIRIIMHQHILSSVVISHNLSLYLTIRFRCAQL